MFVVRINRDLCKSCGFCIAVCPRKLIVLDTQLNRRGILPAKLDGSPDKCIGCGNCAVMCPDAAIEIDEVPDKAGKK